MITQAEQVDLYDVQTQLDILVKLRFLGGGRLSSAYEDRYRNLARRESRLLAAR